jgi:hypothetical protein
MAANREADRNLDPLPFYTHDQATGPQGQIVATLGYRYDPWVGKGTKGFPDPVQVTTGELETKGRTGRYLGS